MAAVNNDAEEALNDIDVIEEMMSEEEVNDSDNDSAIQANSDNDIEDLYDTLKHKHGENLNQLSEQINVTTPTYKPVAKLPGYRLTNSEWSTISTKIDEFINTTTVNMNIFNTKLDSIIDQNNKMMATFTKVMIATSQVLSEIKTSVRDASNLAPHS